MCTFLNTSDRRFHKVETATEKVDVQTVILPILRLAPAENPSPISKADVVQHKRKGGFTDMNVQGLVTGVAFFIHVNSVAFYS